MLRGEDAVAAQIVRQGRSVPIVVYVGLICHELCDEELLRLAQELKFQIVT